jgi:peptidoglycan-associated lipoprotein
MTSNLIRTVLVAVSLVSLAACGGKKKQETIPADSSGGGTTTDNRPTEASTDTTGPAGANLQDVIYFEFDKSDLDASAKQKLEENATWLKENPARTLTIEGHTDEVGTAEYNLGLGERRARTSRDYLVSLGADPSRVSIITYGEERPASQEDSQNRRSVFVATKK